MYGETTDLYAILRKEYLKIAERVTLVVNEAHQPEALPVIAEAFPGCIILITTGCGKSESLKII